MIEITEGDARDIATIMPIMTDAFDPEFGEAWTAAQCLALLAMPHSKLIIARENGNAVGFAMSRWVLDEEELLMIGVEKHHQRRNIGTLILNKIIDHARTSARKTLFIEVRSENPAIYFYSKEKFKPVGLRKNYYKNNDNKMFDALTMSRSI